ncbi:hypothetical protein SPRG_03964 [Saprolegnia parasitica CBS 223.65]|uniref:Uncharacterized protein n=1 Tax=Saprolegnia parasitica (strain CBS 223.65) TaxID=695850 RepID=A0A067CX18_SAPPC|nr:hypothetical protein SPRG_03964 [Saprolegnia parasitica CBS 223.65]KDO31347.1 hypothetical protein SPRG_03964 [Saprolegnia parasitica CBS 223.65]|eukprot:XP_012197946.1 hypothetical protein SPRG_03964 [Saprolegnia parasitica CBS 223.65]
MAAEGLEVLALRLDQVKARAKYVATLKTWCKELSVHGRLLTRGSLHLLLLEGSASGLDALIARYASEPIDENAAGEMIKDSMFDVLGRQPRTGDAVFQNFVDLQVLNDAMMDKLFVQDWGADAAWIAEARTTDRSKRFIARRDAAKLKRKLERQKLAQERDAKKAAAREAKKLEEGGAHEADQGNDDTAEVELSEATTAPSPVTESTENATQPAVEKKTESSQLPKAAQPSKPPKAKQAQPPKAKQAQHSKGKQAQPNQSQSKKGQKKPFQKKGPPQKPGPSKKRSLDPWAAPEAASHDAPSFSMGAKKKARPHPKSKP